MFEDTTDLNSQWGPPQWFSPPSEPLKNMAPKLTLAQPVNANEYDILMMIGDSMRQSVSLQLVDFYPIDRDRVCWVEMMET